MNKTPPRPVFISEGGQLVAGELILSEARAAARGSDETVESLVKDYAGLVYRIAYAVLRSHPDAEDAVQETFIRVLRYGGRLAAVENPKTWLARIAWRVAVDRSKRLRGKQEVSLENFEEPRDEFASHDASADVTLHGKRMSAALEKLIGALPKKLREPLVLSTIEEMTPRETAAVLGINEAAVRSRVFRARQILREKLAAQMDRHLDQETSRK
jgi:RNA polymerase sigma-70 factor, ECF subfamily